MATLVHVSAAATQRDRDQAEVRRAYDNWAVRREEWRQVPADQPETAKLAFGVMCGAFNYLCGLRDTFLDRWDAEPLEVAECAD